VTGYGKHVSTAQYSVTIAAAVAPPPVITSATTATGTAGSAFSYQITASNSPTSYGAAGLPAALSVSSITGLISGMPTASGTSTVTLSATNSGGTGTATLTLTVAPAPVITITISPTSANLTVGGTQQFTAYITGTSNTAVTWSTTGGTVSSGGLYTAPASAGTYTVTATSQADSTKSASAAVTVSAAVQHTVSLTWDSVSGASSYSIYRGASSTSLSLLASAITNTAYTDSSVVSGDTYYYAATATSNGQESGYSNIVDAVIP
jgi:hypothetical protein